MLLGLRRSRQVHVSSLVSCSDQLLLSEAVLVVLVVVVCRLVVGGQVLRQQLVRLAFRNEIASVAHCLQTRSCVRVEITEVRIVELLLFVRLYFIGRDVILKQVVLLQELWVVGGLRQGLQFLFRIFSHQNGLLQLLGQQLLLMLVFQLSFIRLGQRGRLGRPLLLLAARRLRLLERLDLRQLVLFFEELLGFLGLAEGGVRGLVIRAGQLLCLRGGLLLLLGVLVLLADERGQLRDVLLLLLGSCGGRMSTVVVECDQVGKAAILSVRVFGLGYFFERFLFEQTQFFLVRLLLLQLLLRWRLLLLLLLLWLWGLLSRLLLLLAFSFQHVGWDELDEFFVENVQHFQTDRRQLRSLLRQVRF